MGLNQLLNPLPPGKSWENLSEEEREQQQQKNRGDHRHHAIDAMVIACTLPWRHPYRHLQEPRG